MGEKLKNKNKNYMWLNNDIKMFKMPLQGYSIINLIISELGHKAARWR